MKKSILFSLALFLLFSQLYATQTTTDPLTNVKSALKNFCRDIKNIVGVVTMLMIVFAAVVYAGGQMMGAETRARANVWATAALVGAIIGVLILAVAPPVLSYMYKGTTGAIDLSTCS